MTSDEKGSRAIEDTSRMLAAAASRFVLASGEMLIIDNYQMVHGRAPFEARRDGRDRWLKRVNLARVLRGIHVLTGDRSRVIPSVS